MLPFHQNIPEGNCVVKPLFHSELNGRMLVVEVVMEIAEMVVLEGQACKHMSIYLIRNQCLHENLPREAFEQPCKLPGV